MSSVEPGWHKDPADPTTQRYWDGEGWLGDPLPIDATPPPGPPRDAGAPREPRNVPPPALTRPPASFDPPGATTPNAAPANGVPPGTSAPTTPPNAPPPGLWGVANPPPGYRLVQVQPPPPPPAPKPHGYELARPGLRLAARAIDIAAVFLLNVAVNGYFAYRWWQVFWPYYTETVRRLNARESINNVPLPDQYQSLELTIIVIAVALWFAYEVPALANTGQTLGKRLVGIRVQRLDADEPLGFRRAIRRWNTLGLPTFLWTCLIGFALQFVDCLWVLIDRPLHQAMHDKAAGTVVVHVGREHPRRTASSREKVSDKEGSAR